MKSVLTVLLFGSLAVVATSYVPALNAWGPLLALWTAMGVFVAWFVGAEANEVRHDAPRRKAA